MQLASCWVLLSKVGSDIPLKGVTPAELMLLIRDRIAFTGKHPVHDLKVTGDSKRSSELERQRLRRKYGTGLHNERGKVINKDQYKIDTLYPGEGNTLPEKFADISHVLVELSSQVTLEKPLEQLISIDEAIRKLDEEGELETLPVGREALEEIPA